MDLNELMRLSRKKGPFKGGYKNSPEDCGLLRDVLEASYASQDFPYYCGFEGHWKLLEEHADHDLIDRREGDNPLEIFLSCVESGFYPPPEVMIVVASCFHNYIVGGGKKDLSEVFFGKNKSFDISIDVPRLTKYLDFEVNWAKNKNSSESLQLVAENYIAYCSEAGNESEFDQNIDVESFLRGYRRWKKDRVSNKYFE